MGEQISNHKDYRKECRYKASDPQQAGEGCPAPGKDFGRSHQEDHKTYN